MTDLERRALLGDPQAQEKCTRRGIVLRCPHCEGNAKVSFKDARFIGQNIRGDKNLVYRVQVICNKCRSRGKPILTKPLINPNPCLTKWGNCYALWSDVCKEETEKFMPYVVAAISEWNTRPAPPVGRCDDCERRYENEDGVYICSHTETECGDDDYCSHFEPRCEE
jgi:hypothetical protein